MSAAAQAPTEEAGGWRQSKRVFRAVCWLNTRAVQQCFGNNKQAWQYKQLHTTRTNHHDHASKQAYPHKQQQGALTASGRGGAHKEGGGCGINWGVHGDLLSGRGQDVYTAGLAAGCLSCRLPVCAVLPIKARCGAIIDGGLVARRGHCHAQQCSRQHARTTESGQHNLAAGRPTKQQPWPGSRLNLPIFQVCCNNKPAHISRGIGTHCTGQQMTRQCSRSRCQTRTAQW